MKKKGQISTEFLVIVTIAGIGLVLLGYLLFDNLVMTQREVTYQDSLSLAEAIRDSAEELYISPGPNKLTLKYRVPENVREIRIENLSQIVITTDGGSGNDLITVQTNALILQNYTNDGITRGKIILEKSKVNETDMVLIKISSSE
jgi:hypothetical protein